MGLAERRVAKDFEANVFPQLKKEVAGAAKFEVPVDVKWESLAVDGQSHLYVECWPKVYFRPLIQALEAITADEMGRDALKSKLTRIAIQNVGGNYSSSSWAAFDGGVLTLDHEPTSNVDDVDERKQALQALLEKAL